MPPLNSMPYRGPPFIARLPRPNTVRINEAIMNGHFFPRKSKLVFLNNSIDHCPPNAPGRTVPRVMTPLVTKRFPDSGTTKLTQTPLHLPPSLAERGKKPRKNHRPRMDTNQHE